MAGGADNVDVNILRKKVSNFCILFNETPAVKVGHIDVEQNDIWQVLRSLLVMKQVVNSTAGLIVNRDNISQFAQFRQTLYVKRGHRVIIDYPEVCNF